MEVQLKVLVGNNVGQVLKIPGPKFFVGRAEDCQLRPGSDLVSRHHCVLMVEGSTFVVRDFGSKNGTFVNGERINGEAALVNGDQLKIGPLEFEVQLIETLAGAKRPKVTSVKEAAVRTAESGVHEDIDIDALLASGPPAETGDTRELRRGDTAELEVAGTETTITPKPVMPSQEPSPAPSPAPKPEPVAAEAPSKQTGTRKVVGKTGFQAKKVGDDSKDAAAEMLKRLRRR
jgi:predicted component of type VI protein secretion system